MYFLHPRQIYYQCYSLLQVPLVYYLCKQIQEVKSFAGEDEIQISLSSGDSSKLEALSQKTGAELTVSSDDFIGGIRAAIPQKNIMIDNYFLEGLESMRKEFKFDGGLKNE